ncbi:alcohol dehydrogenase [Spironucleus salmonicida]|uniref:Alcohol dehydrogenase n=1 Tax=Spironucleus salmonicida TaxID=348837 RepID=A0A9P8LKU8_9EUKA|nr:alcohol dehydrogenase [Spironucleus salmonicida]
MITAIKHNAVFMYKTEMINNIFKCGFILPEEPYNPDSRANFCWITPSLLNQFYGIGFHDRALVVYMTVHALGAVDQTVSPRAGLGGAFPVFIKENREVDQNQLIQQYFGRNYPLRKS